MRKFISILINQVFNWPESKPVILGITHKLGIYGPAKALYLFLKPSINMDYSEVDPSYLATKELMTQIQEELNHSTSDNPIIFLNK